MKTEEHYVYKITNINPTDTRQFYIGVRTSDNCSAEDDISYLGSSIPLDEAIEAEGVNNFIKEILSIWDTRKEAALEEIRLHDIHDVAANEIYYNLAKATSTGFSRSGISLDTNIKNKISNSLIGTKATSETKAKMSKLRRGKNNKMFGKTHSEEARNKIRLSRLGKVASDETKAKMSISQAGKNNPMFGKTHSIKTKELMKNKKPSKGSNHYKSVMLLITDPNKNQYIVNGSLEEFCEIHAISYHAILNIYNKGKYTTRGTTFGWDAQKVKRINLKQ